MIEIGRVPQLTVESLSILDDASLFASDSLRRCLDALHEPGGGVELLAAEVAGLLRDAARAPGATAALAQA
jgi:hypothetical protein